MKKKILIFGILAVLMLLAISFASTVTSDTSKPIRKESPLFRIRIRQAVREKIKDFIKARFIGERVFFLPLQLLLNGDFFPIREKIATCFTCWDTVKSCGVPSTVLCGPSATCDC